MTSKMAIGAILMATLVLAATFVQKGEAFSDCAKECMPVCLKEQGATIPVCETACENYCKQASAGQKDKGDGGGGLV